MNKGKRKGRSCDAPALCYRQVGTSLEATGRRRAVLLVADVLTPRDGTALLVDFLHRKVGHEAVRGGTVPVALDGLEEHAVSLTAGVGLSEGGRIDSEETSSSRSILMSY